MNNLLVLYAEIMPYNFAAYLALLQIRSDVIIDIVRWGSDKKLTPYIPPESKCIHYYLETDTSLDDLKRLHQKKSYSVVLVCGRMEAKYLSFIRFIQKTKNRPVILGQSDEQFSGSRKQKLVKLFSYSLYRRYFDKMLVPGYYQYEYMRYLGFKKHQIHIGAYTADVNKFNSYYTSKTVSRQKRNILNLLFIGRIEKIKGVELLIEAIAIFNETSHRKIKLKMVGSGSITGEIKSVPFVDHENFKDQDALLDCLNDVDFFILPSLKEPWGVVIHEMVAAGIPVICSDACGARSAFVMDNYNGFVFKSGDKESLIKTLDKAARISADRLHLFQQRSFELSKSITPELWAEIISSYIPSKDVH